MNNNSRFSILEAVKSAYAFVGREWPYLLRTGLLPMAAQIVTGVFVQFQRPEASIIEVYLWGLPSAMLLGWFVFLETRLLLLGERLDQLPADTAYLADRRQAMKASILMMVLFNMGTAGILALWMAVEEESQSTNEVLNIAGLFVLGAVIWGVRFGITPLLAAVHYPIRPVLRRTAGMLFSLRLIGMGLLCAFPVIFLFRLLIETVVPPADDPAAKLTDGQQLILTLTSAPLSLICAALLGAGAVHALKQLLGASPRGVTT